MPNIFEKLYGPEEAAKRDVAVYVDDDPQGARTMQRIIGRAFSGAVREVLTFPDGQKAADFLADPQNRAKVAMVITDREMPEMTGEQLVAAVRRDIADIGIPIMLMSGKAYADAEGKMSVTGGEGGDVQMVNEVRDSGELDGIFARDGFERAAFVAAVENAVEHRLQMLTGVLQGEASNTDTAESGATAAPEVDAGSESES